MNQCYSGGGVKTSLDGGFNNKEDEMKTLSRGTVSIIACVILVVSFSATVSAEDEVFVVSAGRTGDANYILSAGDGTFSRNEYDPGLGWRNI